MGWGEEGKYKAKRVGRLVGGWVRLGKYNSESAGWWVVCGWVGGWVGGGEQV